MTYIPNVYSTRLGEAAPVFGEIGPNLTNSPDYRRRHPFPTYWVAVTYNRKIDPDGGDEPTNYQKWSESNSRFLEYVANNGSFTKIFTTRSSYGERLLHLYRKKPSLKRIHPSEINIRKLNNTSPCDCCGIAHTELVTALERKHPIYLFENLGTVVLDYFKQNSEEVINIDGIFIVKELDISKLNLLRQVITEVALKSNKLYKKGKVATVYDRGEVGMKVIRNHLVKDLKLKK